MLYDKDLDRTMRRNMDKLADAILQKAKTLKSGSDMKFVLDIIDRTSEVELPGKWKNFHSGYVLILFILPLVQFQMPRTLP